MVFWHELIDESRFFELLNNIRCLRRYGYNVTPGAGFDDEKSLLMSQMSLEKRFGQSAVFVASTLMENGGVPQSATPEDLLKEAIHVISCGYEDKTDWGSEVCILFVHMLLTSLFFPIWNSHSKLASMNMKIPSKFQYIVNNTRGVKIAF